MRAYELEESAVEELKNRLPKLKVHDYNTIDRLMNHISIKHKITGKKLHDMFVRKYGHTPDIYIKKIKNRLGEEGVAEGFPQPGESSGKAKQFNPNAKIQSREMTLDQILNTVKGIPYVNNVIDDWDAKDYSWNVTKKVIEYAQHLQKNPQSVANLPPLVVIDGKLDDGAHRLSAINLLQKRMDPKNPLWKQVKLKVNFGTSADVASNQGVAEGSLKEFASPGDGDDNGPDEEEILFRLAKQWWNGTEQDMIRAQRTLASMGWEIGEDEGYDEGGVFVVRAGDVNGKSYISWSHNDLDEVDEGAPITATPGSTEPGGAVDNFKQQMANNTEVKYQKNLAGVAEGNSIKKNSKVVEGVEGPDDIQKIKDFIKWSHKTLNMQKPYPKITLSKNTEVAQKGHHTGVHKGNNIWVYVGNRNLIDIFRTIFHELTHHRQMQLGMIKDGDSYPGSPIEMLADMAAGKYIKIYGKNHPEMFQ